LVKHKSQLALQPTDERKASNKSRGTSASSREWSQLFLNRKRAEQNDKKDYAL